MKETLSERMKNIYGKCSTFMVRSNDMDRNRIYMHLSYVYRDRRRQEHSEAYTLPNVLKMASNTAYTAERCTGERCTPVLRGNWKNHILRTLFRKKDKRVSSKKQRLSFFASQKKQLLY